MNITAIIITAIICITLAYISTHSDGGEGGKNNESNFNNDPKRGR